MLHPLTTVNRSRETSRQRSNARFYVCQRGGIILRVCRMRLENARATRSPIRSRSLLHSPFRRARNSYVYIHTSRFHSIRTLALCLRALSKSATPLENSLQSNYWIHSPPALPFLVYAAFYGPPCATDLENPCGSRSRVILLLANRTRAEISSYTLSRDNYNPWVRQESL